MGGWIIKQFCTFKIDAEIYFCTFQILGNALNWHIKLPKICFPVMKYQSPKIQIDNSLRKLNVKSLTTYLKQVLFTETEKKSCLKAFFFLKQNTGYQFNLIFKHDYKKSIFCFIIYLS